ncbi:MAG: hypothetical protein IPM35_39895 [Myxococcales bacterium]|nr:hypothetical protein [Myxococcales bacterium]
MGGCRLVWGAAIFGSVIACGGEEFASNGTGGAAGAGATASGGSSAGGSAGSGASSGAGGSGGASGGSGGASGGSSGSGGASGGSSGSGGASGGSSGSGGASGGSSGSGGSGGASGGSGGASGGSGGSGGNVASCGVPSADQSALLLHTTLDNQSAAQTPAFMKAPQAGYVSGTFTSPGPCGGVFVVDHSSDCVKYPATGNIDPKSGTLDFFFRPRFEKNDGLSHKLFSLTNTYMQLLKTASPEQGLTFGMPGTPIATVDNANLTFVKDQWTRITVTWLENSGQITVTIYLDGVQKAQATKTFPTATPPSPLNMYIGNLGCVSNDHAMGDFDDFKIYDKVAPPTG